MEPMRHIPTAGSALSENREMLFISSHHGVGASESLWIETATWLARQGVPVRAGMTWADRHPERIAPLVAAGAQVQWLQRSSLTQRLQRKLLPGRDLELRALQRLSGVGRKTALVLISQGNDHSALPWVEACQRLGLKAAVVTHGIVPSDWPNDRFGERLQKAFLSLAMSFWVSLRNQADFEEQIGVRLPRARLVWNPIKVPRTVDVAWPVNMDLWRMACVARLQTRPKGHDLLLKAMAEPHWRDRPLTLSFFGTGENSNGLERLAKMLGISDRVQFHGHVDGVQEVWRDHHLIAQPSRHEGMPLSLIEALMCGRPALVTDVAGHAELITEGENGFVAEAATVRHLDAALQRAWDQRSAWQSMGAAAAVRVRAQAPEDPVVDFAQTLLALAGDKPQKIRS